MRKDRCSKINGWSNIRDEKTFGANNAWGVLENCWSADVELLAALDGFKMDFGFPEEGLFALLDLLFPVYRVQLGGVVCW